MPVHLKLKNLAVFNINFFFCKFINKLFVIMFVFGFYVTNTVNNVSALNFCTNVVVATPLEAFKTDVFVSWSYYFFYPVISNFQVNTQTTFLFNLFMIIILIISIFYDMLGLRLITQFYIGLCSFYLEQVGYLMRGYFVSFLTILIIIGGFNVFGLVPYAGSFTAQIVVNLGFTIGIIIGLVCIGFNKDGWGFLLVFVPKNIPSVMVPFLFLIELLSFFMRIFSMSIRLFSNMVAGHSLLHLLSEFINFIINLSFGKTFCIIISVFPIIILYGWVLFELFVAFLQAYVFVLLYLLYLSDVNKSH